MKLCSGLAFLILGAVGTVSGQTRVEERRWVPPDASIRIHNLVGSTRVIGWDRDTIAVSGTLAPGSGRLYLAAGRAGAKLGVELPANENQAGPSHLEIRVPARARVWVKSASAEIEVSDVTGSLDLNSVSGRIRARGKPRDIIVESMDGTVEIAAAAPWVRVKTASGSVTLRGGTGDLVASTVSGTIRVEGGPFQRGRFESVVGDIHFEGRLDPAGSFHFESHSGEIELRLAEAVAAEFEVTSFDGEIENGLSRATPRPGRDLRSKELSFSLGSGGAYVTVRNFKGRVVLGRKR